jgi:hypothetical protein
MLYGLCIIARSVIVVVFDAQVLYLYYAYIKGEGIYLLQVLST